MVELAGPRESDAAKALHERYDTLHDWRRQVADLYAAVRAMNGEEGWRHWRSVRDRLFREHPQSPLSAAAGPSSAASTASPTIPLCASP